MGWKLVFMSDAETGDPSRPFKEEDRRAFASQVAQGAPVRLGITVDGFGVEEMFEPTDRLFVHNGQVHALVTQFAMNVQSDGSAPITRWDANFSPTTAVYSSDGKERHRIPPGTLPGHDYRNPLPMRWFVEVEDGTDKPVWEKLYEHNEDGKPRDGSLETLRKAALLGRPIRIVSHKLNEIDTVIFPTRRVITNQGHVFAVVPLYIINFRYRPGENPKFDPYNFDAYVGAPSECGIALFGTDGKERYRRGVDSEEKRLGRRLEWYARRY